MKRPRKGQQGSDKAGDGCWGRPLMDSLSSSYSEHLAMFFLFFSLLPAGLRQMRKNDSCRSCPAGSVSPGDSECVFILYK